MIIEWSWIYYYTLLKNCEYIFIVLIKSLEGYKILRLWKYYIKANSPRFDITSCQNSEKKKNGTQLDMKSLLHVTD